MAYTTDSYIRTRTTTTGRYIHTPTTATVHIPLLMTSLDSASLCALLFLCVHGISRETLVLNRGRGVHGANTLRKSGPEIFKLVTLPQKGPDRRASFCVRGKWTLCDTEMETTRRRCKNSAHGKTNDSIK